MSVFILILCVFRFCMFVICNFLHFNLLFFSLLTELVYFVSLQLCCCIISSLELEAIRDRNVFYKLKKPQQAARAPFLSLCSGCSSAPRLDQPTSKCSIWLGFSKPFKVWKVYRPLLSSLGTFALEHWLLTLSYTPLNP